MVVLVHNILPPYRVPLFKEIARRESDFTVVLSRLTHPKRRHWVVPDVEGLGFEVRLLRTLGIDWKTGALDLSIGTRRALDELDPAAVVAAGWDLVSSWAARRWCHDRDRPFILWSESTGLSSRRSGRLARSVRRRFVSGIAAAIVPGVEAEEFLRHHGFCGPVTFMPNPVALEGLRELRRVGPNESGELLFIGELSARKGVDNLLDCIPQLLPLCDRVRFVGRGPLEEAVEAASRQWDRVSWDPWREGAALVDAYSWADTVVLPSRRDPWPLVGAESIVAGRRLVLGQGVGSATELAAASLAVRQIQGDQPSAIVDAVRAVRDSAPPASSRLCFSATDSAASFLEAVPT